MWAVPLQPNQQVHHPVRFTDYQIVVRSVGRALMYQYSKPYEHLQHIMRGLPSHYHLCQLQQLLVSSVWESQ